MQVERARNGGLAAEFGAGWNLSSNAASTRAPGELTANPASPDEDRNRTWTDGVFRFRDEPLSMIVSRLEKYYGIEIAVDDSLGSVRYTGAFPLEQKITEVLETLNFEKRFTVVQHGNDFALEKK